MIVCPNCKHDNPEGATNCEACYTALPATKSCPSCGASIQADATFCGQCGHNLKVADPKTPILLNPPAAPVLETPPETASVGLPPTVLTNPEPELSSPIPPAVEPPPVVEPPIAEPTVAAALPETELTAPTVPPVAEVAASAPPEVAVPSIPEEAAATTVPPVTTQMQATACQLLHLQTNTPLEIPPHLQVVAVGKPNDQTPPDIDVSGFPCAEVVSRIHATIRKEGESYYIEDVGSANGTYINHNVLSKGNRHLLRTGDRIGLGKGDLVTFIFQTAS
jgi:FHA domain/Double zinc ribbon